MRTSAEFPMAHESDCVIDGITQIVDAARFLKVYQERRSDIEDVVFLPPTLGSEGFGAFKITFCNVELSETYEW